MKTTEELEAIYVAAKKLYDSEYEIFFKLDINLVGFEFMETRRVHFQLLYDAMKKAEREWKNSKYVSSPSTSQS